MRSTFSVLFVLGALGCGGGQAVTPEHQTQREEREPDRESSEDGAQITGLMGTIPRDEVEDALNPRMQRFFACFEARMRRVEFLSGNIRLSFRIHTDGNVMWVHTSESDVGDREAEQCILQIARGVRFPRPRGGEAEFSWGFGFDAPEDVRPPLDWAEGNLGDRSADVAELARECDARGSYSVTAYITPGGRVLAAGGSTPTADGEAALDCILERVRGWHMPDPGSYAAKITFAVQ
jgi:hypothetical protein